jgi:hypothetical protein
LSSLPGPVKGVWGFFLTRTVGEQERRTMARRDQNTFIKRQKEIERVRKAKEKMDRRHGKKKLEELEATPAPVESTEESDGEGGIDADTAPEAAPLGE